MRCNGVASGSMIITTCVQDGAASARSKGLSCNVLPRLTSHCRLAKEQTQKARFASASALLASVEFWEGVGLLGQIGAGKELKSSHEADELLTPPVAHKDLGCQGLQELCV